jgi:hypothetical protein
LKKKGKNRKKKNKNKKNGGGHSDSQFFFSLNNWGHFWNSPKKYSVILEILDHKRT